MHMRILLGFAGEIGRGGCWPLRVRVGLATRERWKADDRFHAKPGHAHFVERQGRAGGGCLGACVLSEISESPPRLYRGGGERRELGLRARTVPLAQNITTALP